MSGEQLLRLLASHKTTIPIWSRKKTETLCSVTLLNSAIRSSFFKPFVQPYPFSTFSTTSSALNTTNYAMKSQLKLYSKSTYASSNPTKILCSNVSNSAKVAGSAPTSENEKTSSTLSNQPSHSQPDGISIKVHHGLPHLTVPLPSRNEKCVFVLRPITHTIGDLLDMLQTEDHGIDRTVIRNTDGVRMAATTSIQSLLQAKSFDLVINETCYRVTPPSLDDSSSSIECLSGTAVLTDNQIKTMGDVRLLVGQLYEVRFCC